MKKIVIASAAAVMAVPAFAADVQMPTIYGQVNKEIRYVSQKSYAGYSKVSNLMDVANSETRLGAKGSFDAATTLKVNYNLLMGLNSSDSSTSGGAGSGRIRIRTAELSFSDFWGTVFGGQTADISSVVGAKLDPLATTFAGVIGTDQASLIKNASANIGYLDRGRIDQIGYKTPEYFGMQYTIATSNVAYDTQSATVTTVDNNDLKPASGARAAQRIYNVLSYTNKVNDNLSLSAWVSYNTLSGTAWKKNEDYLGALSVTFNEFTLAGQYTKAAEQLKSATYKKKYDIMQASVKWTRGNHTAALTYANRKNDEVANATLAKFSEKGKYNQMAAGYMYALTKNVQLKGTYSMYTAKTDSKQAGVDPKNTANTVALGTLITF